MARAKNLILADIRQAALDLSAECRKPGEFVDAVDALTAKADGIQTALDDIITLHDELNP